jgi:protein-S-isoprenylcysteine O-methyltransferase Ste14
MDGDLEYVFLIPLLFGFGANVASAFTAAYSRRWGERRGSLTSVLLRDVLGVPFWAAGFLLAAAVSSPPLFASSAATTTAGWVLIAAGGAVIVVALASIRLKSVRPSAADGLVRDGLYGRVRHPIHAGAIIEFCGLALVAPSRSLVLACGLGIAWLLAQTRAEEADLLQRMPSYRSYMAEVPCLLPRLRSS